MAEQNPVNAQTGGWSTKVQSLATLIQVLSIVVASALSIWSFNEARKKEAEARISENIKYEQQRADEARRQRIEAAKPFLEIRLQKYMDALKVAGVLASPDEHTPAEIKAAEKRFGELYWGELSLVEAHEVESSMVNLANSMDKFSTMTPRQQAALNLAHTVRDSLVASWGVDEQYVRNK